MFAIAGAAALAASWNAQAQENKYDYPVDTVTLYTHSKPGSGSDLFLRSISKELAEEMGVNFVVDYWAGGSGAKAMANLADAPADGSAFYATTPTHITTSLLSKPEKTYEDIDYAVNIFYDPEVFYARKDSPVNTVKEAVDFAKANPGKAKWGAASAGSLERQILENLKRKTGADVAVVPHEDGAGLLISVLNGTVDFGVGELQELAGQIEAGEVKVIGVYFPERLATLPDVATLKEQGVDDEVMVKFRGLAAPKGVPDETIAKLEKAVRAVLDDAAYKEEYSKNSLIPGVMGREEYRKFVADFVESQKKFYQEFNVTEAD